MQDYILNLVESLLAEKTSEPKSVSFVEVQTKLNQDIKPIINSLIQDGKLGFYKGLNQIYLTKPK